jgi:pimeloyl-ACP methyl ester carboxylesterase
MSQHVVHRGGVRLGYERRGSGPAVVLIPGLGMPGRMWLTLPGGLVKTGFTVVIPDNRGAGRSDVPWPPYRMRDLADDVASVMRSAGETPALVVGISLGGMIAQVLALRHPDAVSGLVLAATTPGLPLARPAHLGFLALMVRLHLGDQRALEPLRLRIVHPRSLERNPHLLDPWDAVARREPTSLTGLLGQLSAAAMHRTGLSLARIRCPTEVIAGEDDLIIPPVNSRILARRIAGATLTLLPGAGHAFPLEVPAALPDAIRRVHQRVVGQG